MANEKILIVEDELIVAQSLENQLRKLGYNIAGKAGYGQEAIDLAGQTNPDMVLMDIKLSGSMDGVEAAEHINKKFGIPVVFLSAFADKETLQRAKITDPYGYIVKPFELRKLYTTIEIALYKHQMEKKLKESELRFRTLAQSSPVGIFQTDTEGHCVYVNERWCQVSGLTPEQAMDKGWQQSLHPEDKQHVSDTWYKMARENGVFALEYRFLTPDDKISWVYGHAAPLTDEDGNHIGYIGTITDITERKSLEDELLTNKKLEAIGILAGGIAHDFNNLLSVIMGNVSMLKSYHNLSQVQYRMMEQVESAVSQAADLAQKLITFSKGGWLNRKKIEAQSFFEDIISEKFPQLDGIVKTDFPHNLHRIDGDRSQLKQAFTNIITNAVEAGNNVNEISINAQNFTAAEKDEPLEQGNYVKFTITDRGCGISPENAGKVFVPYFTTKSRGAQKGLGLGLTICYSIIQKHGGHIRVNSAVNEGTTIDVFVPAPTDEKTETPGTREPGAPAAKIMVMDDEFVVQDITKKMLERLGYKVEIFEEGQQAVQAYQLALDKGEPFHLVFLDIVNKTGMGGKETIRKILQADPLVKAVAISGFTDVSETANLKKDGFKEVLFKPFKYSDLKGVLEKISFSPGV